jgi:CubicO group peptidase (beta-lactamase class C family)
MVILGQILSKVGHKPLVTLLRQQVLNPLGLTNTVASQTGSIPSPVLHAYSSEEEWRSASRRRSRSMKSPASEPGGDVRLKRGVLPADHGRLTTPRWG